MQTERERVSRVVVEPLIARGLAPRKGADVDVLLGDYTAALGMIPQDALAKAFADVIRDWTFAGWPQPGVFRKAAERYTDLADEAPVRRGPGGGEIAHSVAARDYVSKRLCVNNGRLFHRCNAQGPWFKTQIENFLYARALVCLAAGRTPHIGNADLEAEMIALEPEAAERRRSAEQVARSAAPKQVHHQKLETI